MAITRAGAGKPGGKPQFTRLIWRDIHARRHSLTPLDKKKKKPIAGLIIIINDKMSMKGSGKVFRESKKTSLLMALRPHL
jgi:hypothetical protein